MSEILVVDDTPAVLRLTDRVLGDAGYTMTSAVNGAEALRFASQRRFDVAIVDYDIPAPNGLEVIRMLRDTQPQCARILMSGSLDTAVTIEAVNDGEVCRVLQKPYGPGALVEAVQEALSMRERQAKQYFAASEQSLQQEKEQLYQCMADGSIELAIQPIVSAGDGQVFGFEALLRCQHPVLCGPLPVLQAVERHDAFGDLGEVVAHLAAGWLPRIPGAAKLFVNLHPQELADPERLLHNMKPLHAQSDRVVIEITERNNVHSVPNWEQSLAALTDAGYALALDDLGAGYNSLAMLASISPSYIKIDMSIVRNLHESTRKRRLVELLCRFGKATGATVVAEGIETEAEDQAVRTCGVDLLQGYLFGKPELRPLHG